MKKNITGMKFLQYKKTDGLICVIECIRCGKIHEIKKKYRSNYYCKCGQNIIYACLINHVNYILYKHEKLNSDNIQKFDKYKG